MAVGTLGILSYYIYQFKKGDVTLVHQSKEGDLIPVQSSETCKFKWSNLLDHKINKTITNDFYQAPVISIFAILDAEQEDTEDTFKHSKV